jgi:hypothetical protein
MSISNRPSLTSNIKPVKMCILAWPRECPGEMKVDIVEAVEAVANAFLQGQSTPMPDGSAQESASLYAARAEYTADGFQMWLDPQVGKINAACEPMRKLMRDNAAKSLAQAGAKLTLAQRALFALPFVREMNKANIDDGELTLFAHRETARLIGLWSQSAGPTRSVAAATAAATRHAIELLSRAAGRAQTDSASNGEAREQQAPGLARSGRKIAP